jgi:hypothetical protein
MSYQRRAYDDQDSTREMVDDCLACQHQLARPRGVFDPITMEPAPSLSFDDFPQEKAKPGIEVSEAAAHLASRLHLHLD